VKSYDTRTAVAEAMAAGTIGPETRVLTLQNGLGNVEALQGHVAPSRLLAGATTIGVTFAEPGLIERGGPGYLRLGCPEGRPENAEPIAQLFREVGLPAEVADDCISEIWAKVVVNVAINPLAAITGLRNGSLLEIPALRALMERAAEEAIQVGRASGVALPDDVALRPRITAEKTAKNKSSMLQDIERGRRTEIDSLCGAIVKRGEEKGLDVSTNFALWALVQGIEQSTRLG
jgi:2-dehydropantoate 2-reductase